MAVTKYVTSTCFSLTKKCKLLIGKESCLSFTTALANENNLLSIDLPHPTFDFNGSGFKFK